MVSRFPEESATMAVSNLWISRAKFPGKGADPTPVVIHTFSPLSTVNPQYLVLTNPPNPYM